MTQLRTTLDVAAAWHAQLESPDMAWDAFGAWLEADQSHRDAYDAIALLDAQIDEAAPAIASFLPANDDTQDVGVSASGRPRSALWRWTGLGVGGALAAWLAFVLVSPSANDKAQVFVTGRGEIRSVMLADGSHMQIDRGSRLAVSGGGAPVIEIAQGAASFAVRHDPSRVLIVRAGGYDIRDLGTRFDVVSARGRVAVRVAQGVVSVMPTGEAAADTTVLRAGQELYIVPDQGIAVRRRIDPAHVADWSDGRLEYDGAPLAVVAADISRYVDIPLLVDPSAATLRFSGVLTIGDGSRLVEQLRAVLPIRVRRVDGVVHMGAAGTR